MPNDDTIVCYPVVKCWLIKAPKSGSITQKYDFKQKNWKPLETGECYSNIKETIYYRPKKIQKAKKQFFKII